MADSDELEAVYRRHYPLLRDKCRRMLRDPQEAEDVAQETFVRFWKSGPPPSEIFAATAWLYRTSTHLAIDRLRAAAARGTHASQQAALDEPSGEGGGAAAEARSELAELARQLPEDELELLVLQKLDGLTQDELAEVSGRSPRTVRRLLARCEARLQALGKDR